MIITRAGAPPLAALGVGAVVARYTVASFRTLGDTTAAQAFLALRNLSTDKALVLQQARVWSDCVAALTGAEGNVRVGRNAAAGLGGGTNVPKVLLDSRHSSDALITALGATASDAGAATAITGATNLVPGNGNVWGQAAAPVMHTLAGQRFALVQDLAPEWPPILVPGEAALVQYVGPAAQNPVTVQYVVTLTVLECGLL